MYGSLTIQKFRHAQALLTYILTKMPYHRHLNRAVRITYGLWYRWNELNHECGLHIECTQNFRLEQTELITFLKYNDNVHNEWQAAHFRIQRELTVRLHQTFICELLLQLCLHQQKTSEAGVCLPSHLHQSYRCWWCWNHLNSQTALWHETG